MPTQSHELRRFQSPLQQPCRGHRQPTTAAHQGFTLWEMLAVMTVLGILAAIASPMWLSFMSTRNLTVAQDQVYQAMRQAQSEAKQQRVNWETSLRTTNGAVQLAIHPQSALPGAISWETLQANVQIDVSETTLPRTGDRYRVQFTPQGRVHSGLGRVTFKGTHGGRAKRCVLVSTLLGAVRKGEDHPRPQNGRYCY